MLPKTNNIKTKQQRADRSLFWTIQGTVVAGLLALGVSACETQQRATVAPAAPAGPIAAEPTTPAVSAAPDTPAEPLDASPIPITEPLTELVGQTVTVSTNVQSVLTPNLFTVYDTESLRGQTVLVASKMPAPPVGTNIELEGVVRDFVAVDVERDYGIDIEPGIEQQYVNKPYIAAIAMERVD